MGLDMWFSKGGGLLLFPDILIAFIDNRVQLEVLGGSVFFKHVIFKHVLMQELFVDGVVCGVLFHFFGKGRLGLVCSMELVDKGRNTLLLMFLASL